MAGALVLALSACENELPTNSLSLQLELPDTPYTYQVGFAGDSTNLVINNHKATLGRVLFYDRQLSANNSLSCASCHKQSIAFTDNARFSKGFGGKLTTRNSMPIQDLGPSFFVGFGVNSQPKPNTLNVTDSFLPGFGPKVLFWDGRENVLNKMVLRPVVNHVEMGVGDLNLLAEKLAAVPYYPTLFNKAFGSSEVTSEKIADAIAAFVSSINATQTKFDHWARQEAVLSAEEQRGFQLFFEKYDCNSCHQITSPNGYISAGTFANIGLDEQYADQGVARVSGNEADAGKFKIPSLRNVALTAPYMHDGRFSTLEEVIDHYSEGMQDNPNLDPRLRTAQGDPKVMNISASEKQAIIAFLHTLTDRQMISDVRFSDPFRVK